MHHTNSFPGKLIIKDYNYVPPLVPNVTRFPHVTLFSAILPSEPTNSRRVRRLFKWPNGRFKFKADGRSVRFCEPAQIVFGSKKRAAVAILRWIW